MITVCRFCMGAGYTGTWNNIRSICGNCRGLGEVRNIRPVIGASMNDTRVSHPESDTATD